MKRDFKPQGDLRDSPVAKIVGHLVRTTFTGALEIQDAVGQNRAFFLEGVPQGARLSRMKHPFGRILVGAGLITDEQLSEALAIHARTQQLLGQVLLEMKALTQAQLDETMVRQSQLNFLSLFALREGRYEVHAGLVHLTDFTPAPLAPVIALYEGVRDFATQDVTSELIADLALLGVELLEDKRDVAAPLGPAEQVAVEMLAKPCFLGEVARSVPLPAVHLRSLVYALHEVGALARIPATSVPRS